MAAIHTISKLIHRLQGELVATHYLLIDLRLGVERRVDAGEDDWVSVLGRELCTLEDVTAELIGLTEDATLVIERAAGFGTEPEFRLGGFAS